MKVGAEQKICQNCKNEFLIEPEDFKFYEKIKVPPPTFCPECRLQRRLAWLPGIRLFKRPCNLCKKEKICAFPPDAPYTVYCQECWWSDKWDPLDYGREYDFSRPFFEQFDELLHKVPLLGLSVDKISVGLSPYTNHCGHSKNCYLIFYSDDNENCFHGFYLNHCKDLLDCSITFESERCYDDEHSFRNYQVVYTQGNVTTSVDSFFLRDCDNCQNCFGSANLRNRSYVFFNEQLTKEEYQKRLSKIDLGSYKNYVEYKTKAIEFWKQFSPRPAYDDFSINCTGSYIFESKNCQECYDSVGVEDSKYIMLIKTPYVRDSYDYTDWGNKAEKIYDSIVVGEDAMNVRFCNELGFGMYDCEYAKLAVGANQFGCVSVRNEEYCILNRRYAKEEFNELRAKILEQMNEMPSIDKQGNTYRYGEFFPMELSPHGYNDTFAHLFFPLAKEQALAKGLKWQEQNSAEYETTIEAADLPDHIRDASEEILKEIIRCSSCRRGYRIIPRELSFLKEMNLPPPRQCPFCRIGEKMNHWVGQMRLRERVCSKCGQKFRTHYTELDAPKIYCKECYQAEII